MSEEEINYEIYNCITDLDTLKVLDKRAMEDLKNNTHKIEQPEVLTIIREFIRLKNDYNKEKEKREILQTNYEILQGEMDRIGIDTLRLEAGNSTDDVIEEIKKKDKIIDKMAEEIYNLGQKQDMRNDNITIWIDKEHILNYFTKLVEEKSK